ncbi:uncharacterized protein LOC129790332 [Lutzomyia longipalpis]|uniref:uncharacterized protein LOC129790332 n=1 Tax=Lutzomyia longipalpis TaxID=7200 RepID=UPI002483986C|nr:uncharacterized protein LOC129790332 [Lutzomyia longipalpis]
MNKFSVFELVQLIEIFKNEPILWNRPRTTFTTPERQDMVENVAKRFGRTPGDIEKCWVALREKYRRERASEMANVQRKYRKEPWELMSHLSFLDELYCPQSKGAPPPAEPQPLAQPPKSNSKKFQVGNMVKILPSTSGDNVIIRRVGRKSTPGVPGELVGVGKLKLANLADLQKKPNSPKSAERPESPENARKSNEVNSSMLSPYHEPELSDKSDHHPQYEKDARSVRSVSPAISIVSSTLFPISSDKHEDGMRFKMSRNSRVIKKMEDERRELLAVLKNLTREKGAAESYGEYLTKKLKSWSTEKQNRAIRKFNIVIGEIEEEDE